MYKVKTMLRFINSEHKSLSTTVTVAIRNCLPIICFAWSAVISSAAAQDSVANVSPVRTSRGSSISSVFGPKPFTKEPSLFLMALPNVGLMAGGGATQTSGNTARYDFGAASALDTPQIEHTFTLRNDGKVPLTLQRLQPTCVCTSATLVAASPAMTKPTRAGRPDSSVMAGLTVLAPGQQVSVRITVDSARLSPGPVTKGVLVFVRQNPKPVALLQVSGMLLPCITFTPALVDFGMVKAGQIPTADVSVTVDPRLAPGGTLPPLVSSNPAVRVTTAPDAALPNGPAFVGAGTPKPLTHRYRVTLAPDVPLGQVAGSLSFAALPAASSTRPDASRVALILRGHSALVSGLVQGDVSASPSVVEFGAVPLGLPTTRRVALAGMAAALQAAKVVTANTWLAARLLNPDQSSVVGTGMGAAALPGGVLEVTLGPQAPAGDLQSQLMITLASGQRLLLPVTATVRARP